MTITQGVYCVSDDMYIFFNTILLADILLPFYKWENGVKIDSSMDQKLVESC